MTSLLNLNVYQNFVLCIYTVNKNHVTAFKMNVPLQLSRLLQCIYWQMVARQTWEPQNSCATRRYPGIASDCCSNCYDSNKGQETTVS